MREARTRILTVDEARRQVETVAQHVETTLPNTGGTPTPQQIANRLRRLARRLRARNARGHLNQDDALARSFEGQASAIRNHVDSGVQAIVEPVIERAVRPVCNNPQACRRR